MLVLGSAEWRSNAAREAVAAAEEAVGDPFGVVRILRDRLGCNLSKAHLLLLCHAWGYRADKWCAARAHTPRYTASVVRVQLTPRGRVQAAQDERDGHQAAEGGHNAADIECR